MTTELMKFRKSDEISAAAGVLFHRLPMTSKTRSSSPKSAKNEYYKALPHMDAASLLDLLKQQAMERDGKSRTLSNAMTVLRHAHMMIEKAEAALSAHEERIAHLETLSTSDELTSIKNRRGFFEAFTAELDRCDRGISSGGLLIVIDLDNFKAINDTFGHLAGDACLRLIASTLAEEVRLMDVAARLGGDEFVLLLSDTTKSKAAKRAQELAWRLNNLSLAWNGDIIPLRASLGLQEYTKGESAEQIFGGADDHLYVSKARRKGKVTRKTMKKANSG